MQTKTPTTTVLFDLNGESDAQTNYVRVCTVPSHFGLAKFRDYYHQTTITLNVSQSTDIEQTCHILKIDGLDKWARISANIHVFFFSRSVSFGEIIFIINERAGQKWQRQTKNPLNWTGTKLKFSVHYRWMDWQSYFCIIIFREKIAIVSSNWNSNFDIFELPMCKHLIWKQCIDIVRHISKMRAPHDEKRTTQDCSWQSSVLFRIYRTLSKMRIKI